MQYQIGIDIGNSNLLVTSKDGILLKEPSVICMERDTRKVVAVGSYAEQKYASNPDAYIAFHPFKDSLTDDIELTKDVLASVVANSGAPRDADYLVSVPCDFSALQEELVVSALELMGANSCHLVYSPIAAMAGSFHSLPPAFLSCEIGATKMNIILMCRNRIYYMRTLNVGGNTFDQAIASYVYKKHGAQISLRTAENIKLTIGDIWNYENEKIVEVKGKTIDRIVRITISSKELYEALEQPISQILEAIYIAVSKIPSECVKSIFELGIQLSGGGAMLRGLEQMVAGVTGVPTHVVEEPISTVATGLYEIFGNLNEGIPKSFKNVSEIYIKNCFHI